MSETLPYELPVSFSTLGLYRFLIENSMEFSDGAVTFRSTNSALPVILKIIFGADTHIETNQDGKDFSYSIKMDKVKQRAVPFQFQIRHRENQSRQLSIPHPASQIAIAQFYDHYKSLILYYTGRSPFSVRHPNKITRYTIVRDSVFEERQNHGHGNVEVDGREYDHLRSYFVYHRYDNIHKFYESIEYRNSEKAFGHLLRLDISKCFDSIYTHSITWAVYGRDSVKRNIQRHEGSFADQFDRVMQRLNDDETHGIVIGPEFSRIFAEIILQHVDIVVESRLRSRGLIHGRDYQILRYVDDYFIFMTHPSSRDIIVHEIEHQLRPFKLNLNEAKEKIHATPFISDMSIAKNRVSNDIQVNLLFEEQEIDDHHECHKLEFKSSTQKLISAYKTTLHESGLGPLELVNFTLSNLERRLEGLIEKYISTQSTLEANLAADRLKAMSESNEKATLRAIISSLEFAFYVYGGSPRVGAAIKLARIVSFARKFAAHAKFSTDRCDSIDDLIFRETQIQMNRNPMTETGWVEGLYLLSVLQQLGPHYTVDMRTFCAFTGIALRDEGSVSIPTWYNALVFSSLSKFMGNKSQFLPIQRHLDTWVLTRLQSFDGHGRLIAEQAILALDALGSPYVSEKTKRKVVRLYEPKATNQRIAEAVAAEPHWFTNWQDSDLYYDLQLKRVQEVY